MSHALSVTVQDSRGSPIRGAKVTVVIEGFWKGGSLEAFTDSSGEAEFETADDYEGSRKLTIHVRGQRFGPYSIRGGAYTVQLD